jgi:hypothetical protein
VFQESFSVAGNTSNDGHMRWKEAAIRLRMLIEMIDCITEQFVHERIISGAKPNREP